MSSISKEPVIVDAPSNRSKCKACVYAGGGDPTIRIGSKRVGIPGHAAGVTVQHWCHPACFAQYCLRVDSAPTGRSKCKANGAEIEKGAVRLLIGYKKESTVYKVENTHRTIIPELVALVGKTNVTIHGLGELPLAEQHRVEGAILNCSSDGGGATSTVIGSTGSSKKAEDEAAAKAPNAPASEAIRKRADLLGAETSTMFTQALSTKKVRREQPGETRPKSAMWNLKSPIVEGALELE